jgi:hypothetical protein
MPTVEQARAALQRALAANDTEAAKVIRMDLADALEGEAKATKARGNASAIRGMSATDRVTANIGAGFTNVWQGTKQALLPEALEGRFGASEQDVADKRALDDSLANSVEGGRAWQVVGEAAPFMAIPAGAVARGITAIPKIGAAAQAAGVGSRALPTLMAEGAAIGSAAGGMMPVAEGESRAFNAAIGAVGGAAAPATLAGAGRLYRATPLPGAAGLRERAVARMVGSELGDPAAVGSQIDRAIRAPSLNEIPSTAVLTGNQQMAGTELAYRAMPEFSAGWQQADDAANAARWSALDSTLGDDASVQAAREATDAYKREAFPKFLNSVRKPELARQSVGFESAVQGRLNAAVRDADPNAQAVYGYIMQQREKGARFSPQSLWNIRQTLSSWLDGTPPPGFEGTRGAKMDRPIMEVRAAIDNMLNASSGNKWGRFLEGLAEGAQKETTQKSGQNIRNAFVDETLGIPRKPTRSGDPEITRAALGGAYSKFGKNNFGPTLDWPQQDAVEQVLGGLQRQEDVLGGARKTMSGGGSQTAPLGARLLKERGGSVGSGIVQVLNELRTMGEGKQRQVINRMLQDPRYARSLLQLAADQAAPLTASQRHAILALKGSALAVGAPTVND